MFKLTDRNLDYYDWKGARFELNLAFDNVLLLFDLFADKTLSTSLKLDIALDMLVIDKVMIKQLDGKKALELILDLLMDVLDIDLRADPKKEEEIRIPFYDFTEDAELIYSSFLFDYKIDLFEQQGKLQWHKFIALFRNLSNKSPLGQAIHYRTCKVPKRDKHNEEERRHIVNMKKKYELQCAKELIEKKKVQDLAASFERMKSQHRKK